MGHPEWEGEGRLSLAQRLAQGRIPAGEALHYGLLLAELLRTAHNEGRVYGFLTPSAVWLNGPAVELAPPPGGRHPLTPYTAPELLSGNPATHARADARADIFSFGAILYEMLTGRRAFAGDTPAELANALKHAQPGPTGSPAADQMLAGCLAKDPAARWQQMQKVILELKLLRWVARKAERARQRQAPPAHPVVAPETPPRHPPLQASASPSADFSRVRVEMQQSENRLAARLQLGEKAMAVLNRAVMDALTTLRSQIAGLTSQVAAMQDSPNPASPEEGAVAVSKASLTRIEQKLQAFSARMESIEKGIGVLRDRVARSEQDVQAARQQVTGIDSRMAQDLVAFEQSLQKQARAVESARTAMAQTDNLVERLMEALEALQATVLQRSEEWTAAGVN